MLDMLPPRLASKIAFGDDCWEWRAYTSPYGYGQVRWKDRAYLAHRAVYELVVGPVPEGLELDHLCRNRLCVRPDHLEPVTHAENLRRGDMRGNGALQRARTTCPKGHPYSGENLWVGRNVNGNPKRGCRTCRHELSRRSYLRRRDRVA